MSFSIQSTQQEGIPLIRLQDDKSGTFVSIAPQHGALLHEFAMITADGLQNVIDNYSNITELQKELAISYKSSKLSPFVCRISDGKYLHEEATFEFSNKFIDGSAIHGLLYDKAFTVVDEFADDEQANVLLKYNYKEDDDGYPFRYRCEVRYALFGGNLLQVQTTIINTDEVPIPVADGWHPYFKLGGKVNDWLFYFNSAMMVEFDDRLVPTGHLKEVTTFSEERKIDTIELDNCFLLSSNDNTAACTLHNPQNGLQIAFFPDDNYPYLQVYTPPHRNSIAIENLSAAPDAFNNKMGLLLLLPGHTHSFTVHYRISCE